MRIDSERLAHAEWALVRARREIHAGEMDYFRGWEGTPRLCALTACSLLTISLLALSQGFEA